MTVRNFRTRQDERIQYITPDGIVHDLHDPPSRAVMLYEGDGLLPTEIETVRGPFQHGETVLSYRLPVRTIDLVFRANACNRDEYWDLRDEIIDMLRINRSNINNPSPGVLRWVRADGTIRDLDCVIARGPEWRFPRQWDFFSIQENLRFTAHNPILYDPTLRSSVVQDFTVVTGTDKTYPFTYPFAFAESIISTTKNLNIQYDGDWEEYPTVAIQGPATNPSITNISTGKKIALSGYAIPSTETVTFNLGYAIKTVTNQAGTSLLNKVSTDSDLGVFALQPDPLVSGGLNVFEITITSGGSDTQVAFTHRNRYQGV